MLYVGCNDRILSLLQSQLGRDVHPVDGPDAVETDDVGCVICVHEPPAIDGLSVLEQTAHCPVVFIASDGTERLASDAVAAGADEYIPLDAIDDGDELDAAVTRAIADERYVYDDIVDLLPDMVLVVDLDSRTVVDANETAIRRLGDDREAIVGRQFTDFLLSEDAERVENHLSTATTEPKAAIGDGGVQIGELQTTGDDVIPVEVSLQHLRTGDETLLLGVFHDRSDELRQSAALSQNEQVFRRITETSFDMLYRLDGDGWLEFVSDSAVETLGYTRAEFAEMHFAELVAPESLPTANEVFTRVLAGETVHDYELIVETKRRRRVVLELNTTPVRRDDEVVGILGAARDVTAQRRREQLLDVLHRVFRHNLRNDLTVITGYLEVLDGYLPGDPAARSAFDHIAETVAGLDRLSRKARTVRRAVELESAEAQVDLVRVVEECIERARGEAPEIDVTFDLPDRARIAADERVVLAIWELCENVKKHAGERPSVNVSIRFVDDGDEVELVVDDDGPGLSDQERAILTEARETALKHGSGLGLWLVYWVTTSVGGTVDVDDTDGTRVRLCFPAAAETA